jgi:hypothetical protein
MVVGEIPSPIVFSGEQDDREGRRARWLRAIKRRRGGLALAVFVLLASIGCIALTQTSPAYDAFGWLTWGHQTLHWNLNTDGAPSWKPVTFLFTLPFALFGRAQLSLWVLTSVAAALAGCALAGRIAYRLTSPAGVHPLAASVGALFAALGVLGIGDYTHLIMITSSDPLIMTLCLAAIDRHLARSHRIAFACLVLAGLGRPEVWVFAFLYAAWAWRAQPSMRWFAVAGLALIPVLWFSVPALTSKSWFISGDLALNAKTVIHGNKLVGVFDRVRRLNGLPLELAALGAIAAAVYRRDRTVLTIAGAGLLWILVEIAFALHGWSAVYRYLIEPSAVIAVLAGAGVGQALAATPRRLRSVRWVWPALGLAAIGLMVPYGTRHERTVRAQVDLQHGYHTQLDRLEDVTDRIGGAKAVRACGQPVTLVGDQAIVAWVLGYNVGEIGYRPGREIHAGKAIVLFKPHQLGWEVRVYNTPAALKAQCSQLRADSDFG